MPEYAVPTTVVTCPPCMMCHKSAEVEVPTEALQNWRNGMFIQRAFREMPASQRELLMTGTHPECWDKMWAEDEEE